MGLSSYLKNKAKQSVQNIKAEREYQKSERLEQREQFNQGRKKAEYERGLNSGYGRVTEVTEYNNKGKPTRTQKYGQPAQGGGARSGGRTGGASWQPNWKQAGDIFGGGPSYDAFGIGPPQHSKQQPPMRTTTVDRNGKVRIQEPYERQNPTASHDPTDQFWGSGAPAAPRRKGERDSSDFILG